MKRWLLAALLLATPVLAANKGCPGGSLAAQTATGPSADAILPTGAASLAVQYTTTTGSASVQTEISCDNGTTWALVAGSNLGVSPTVSQAASVLAPICRYRTNVTACTTCNVVVWYACGR